MYVSLEGVNDDNFNGEVSGTEDDIRKGPDDEVLGITYGTVYINKLGVYSLGKALGAEVGIEGGFSDGMSYGNIVGKLEISSLEASMVV